MFEVSKNNPNTKKNNLALRSLRTVVSSINPNIGPNIPYKTANRIRNAVHPNESTMCFARNIATYAENTRFIKKSRKYTLK